MHIPGYTIELETNQAKLRFASYVSNKINYKRRHDLKSQNSHIVIPHITPSNKIRIINLYNRWKLYLIQAQMQGDVSKDLNLDTKIQKTYDEHYWVPNKPPTITAKLCKL